MKRTMIKTARVVLLGAFAATLAAAVACTGDDPVPSPATVPEQEAGPSTDAAPSDSAPPTDSAPPVDAGTGFCEKKTKPGGAADFFCSDFDGDPFDKGWTGKVERADAGILPVTSLASSPPRAVSVAIAANGSAGVNERGAALEWIAAGAAQIDRVEVEVAINKAKDQAALPLLTGLVNLVQVETTAGRISLVFTRGANVEGAAHTGYYVTVEGFDPFTFDSFKVEPAFADEKWARVKLVANLKNGTADVLFNEVPIRSGIGNAKQTATSATVRVGALARFQTIDHAFWFDDVTAAVFRQ